MSLTIKVFFERADGSKEIRRFLINTSAGDNFFTSTKEKIRQLFPALADGKFTLYWQDPDGDHVAFSSSEEMKDAITYASDGLLRVYIFEPKVCPETADQGQQQQPSDKREESQGQGQSQSQGPKPNSGQGAHAHGSDGPVHPHVFCNGCLGPIIGIRYKCCVCPDFDLCQACEVKGLHVEHDMFKIHHPHPIFPPHAGCFFSQYIGGMAPGTHATSSYSSSSSCTSHASSQAGASSQARAGSEKKDDKKTFEEYMNGANFSTFLDPFGIKMSYDFHDGSGNHQGENYHYNWWNRGGKCPAWEHMFRRARQSSTPECHQSQATSDVTGKMNTDSRNSTPENGNTESSREAVNKPGNKSDDWTMEDGNEIHIPSSVPIPMPGPPAPCSSPSRQPPTSTPPPPRPTTAPQLNASVGSSLPTENPSVRPQTNIYPNLQIQQSLEQMLAMGFSDTDGWLTALLTEYDADIGSTLDAIKVKATQQLENLHDGR